MDSGVSRRTCFIEEDDGLASLADMEAGFSGNHNHNNNNNHVLFSRPLSYASSSLRNLLPSSSSSSSVCFSPRSGSRFYDARFEEQQPHFLEACFLCNKPLGNRDIYMYRGDVPFCSEECREEKIEEDEAKEKKLSLSSMKALRKKEQQRKSTSPSKNQDHSYQTGTVAAA